MVKSDCIQSARDNIAELYDYHWLESNAEDLKLVQPIMADNKYIFPVAEHVQGGELGPNPMLNKSKAANELPPSILLTGRIIPGDYLHQSLSIGQ